MRVLAVLAAAVLAGCGSTPAPAPQPVAQQPKLDPSKEPWYSPATAELAGLNREAAKLLADGKVQEAGAVVTKAQPIEARSLSAPEPTLAAMEAASDLDDLYGRMLLRNKQYGWARQVFQKNVIRWKNWKPQTDETARRLAVARAAVAESDRRLAE